MKTLLRGSGGSLVFYFEDGHITLPWLDLYREWEERGWMKLQPGVEVPYPTCTRERPWDRKTLPIRHVECDFVEDTDVLHCPVCDHTWFLGPDTVG